MENAYHDSQAESNTISEKLWAWVQPLEVLVYTNLLSIHLVGKSGLIEAYLSDRPVSRIFLRVAGPSYILSEVGFGFRG